MSWESNAVGKMLDWTFAAMDRSTRPQSDDALMEYRRELQQLHACDEPLEDDDLFSNADYDALDELEDYLAGSPEPEPRQSDLERRGHVR